MDVSNVTRPLKPKPRFPTIPLPARQVGVKDGKPAVSFSSSEIGACEKLFEHSLIAKFTVGRPHLDEIRRSFKLNWPVSGRASLSEIWDSRHVLIIFDSEEDVRAALSSPLNKVGHAYFRLFRWYADYNPKRESTVTTIWVRLPNLPLYLYSSSFIEAIVSTFGYFVNVDDRTKACTALKYARACVELDVTQPIPKAIWINLPDNRSYWQEVEVESKLEYCSKCKVHGHMITSCRKRKDNKAHQAHGPPRVQSNVDQGRVLDAPTKVSQIPKDNAPVSRNIDIGEKSQWQEVTTKRQSKQAVRGTFIQEMVPLGDSDTPTSVENQEAGEVIGENHQTQDDITCLAGESKASPGGNMSGKSAEVFFDERLQSHVHPNGYDHYVDIRDKAGSAKDHPGENSISYITQRSKKKDTAGSKHCLTPPSQ